MTPAPTEGNIEDHDYPNISAAAVLEHDNAGAQFQEEVGCLRKRQRTFPAVSAEHVF